MKQKSLLITLLLAAFLLPAMSLKLMSSTPDTIWTVTLPENQYVGGAIFSNDDSLLITSIGVIDNDGVDRDSSIVYIFSSFTGQIVDSITAERNANHSRGILLAPDTNLMYIFFTHYFDSVYNRIPEYRFLVYNYKSGNIVDSIFFPTNEPCLRPDTSIITHMWFTPDGEKLFMIVKVFKEYDEGGYRIYDDQLFVWNTSDWTIHRKEEYWHSDGLLRIMPNNKMYLTYDNNFYGRDNHCIIFREIETDTLLYYLCENEKSLYSGLIFPKTDTTKFINFVYDKTDFKTRIQVRNQSDISLIKTIDNDTLRDPFYLMLSNDCRYLIFHDGKYLDESVSHYIFDLQNEFIVYKYPRFSYSGTVGYGVKSLSNNGIFIFDGARRTLRMLNAKYTTTSTEEPSDEPSSMLYPNPATDYVEIVIPSLEQGVGGVAPVVRVFNVLGVCVITLPPAPLHSREGSKVRLDVSHLPHGVYFVQIGSRVQRFVKM